MKNKGKMYHKKNKETDYKLIMARLADYHNSSVDIYVWKERQNL